MKKLIYLLSASFLFFTLPTHAKQKKEAPPNYQAKAEIFNADGQQVGRAVFFENGDSVRMIVETIGLPAGNHGIHIHEFGVCERPEFKTAGNHFNPKSKHHGLQNKSGAHGGDMPNLKVEDGSMAGRLEYILPDVNLGSGKDGLLKKDGTSIVIHASYDDQTSDPSGNSGARIACGVIESSR